MNSALRQGEVQPPAQTPHPPYVPVVLPRQPKYSTKAIMPKLCVQCGNEFFPKHALAKTCSDACRKARLAAQQKKYLQQSMGKTPLRAPVVDPAHEQQLKQDEVEVQNDLNVELLKDKYAPRREPLANSTLQSAPRIKFKRIKLPPAGQYAEPGSPEAAAAIERVRSSSKADASSARLEGP